ncbi:hypothetical protein [Erwinia amylovora]|uniref:hypothetical protein n=1 Tax=Erwinia amylovora TaxID=552 RepID=UPI0014444608|nr:hypothetical protein [Erwinia amylovora]
MAAFIFFIIFILGLVLIPYRKIYNRLNQLIDAKALLIGFVLMAFPFIWRLFAPEMDDTPPVHQPGLAGISAAVGAIAEVSSWLILAAGVLMIGYAVWQAREHQAALRKQD